MDVSRIDAYNPNKYDWRNMTAREIIKHEDDGEQVPALYIQWAREFIQSIYSDDKITYEVAVSQKTKPQNVIAVQEANKTQNSTEQDSEIGDEATPQLSKAQQIRQDMQNDGVSLRKQAKYFRKQSRTLVSQSFFPARFILPALKNESGSELSKLAFVIISLDARMESIIANLKNIAVLNSVNEYSDNHDSMVQRAYEEGKELDKEAQKGYSSIDKTESNMDSIGADMADYTPTFDDAIDFGEQTVDIGKELLNNSGYFFLEASVIASGERAIRNGQNGLKSEADAQVSNNKNLDKSDEYYNFIESKSGVQNNNPKEDYKRDKRGVYKNKKDDTQPDNNEPIETKKVTKENMDSGKKEDIKKEDKDLPTDRETLVKLEDEDKGTKHNFVKNASKMTTMQDAPSKSEFADDNQKEQAANEFDKAKANDGADERTLTMALRSDSITADNSAVANIGLAQTIAQMSQSTYNELDQNIQELMNEINSTHEEIKNEMQALNSGGRADGISRINQLNAELRSYGISAQSMAGSTEAIINSYAGELDNIGDAFNDAISKGHAAIAGGEAIIANSEGRWLAFKLINEIIGKNTINVGTRTQQDGMKGIAERAQASTIVSSNLLSITSIKSEIQSKTGVEGVVARTRAVHNVENNNEVNNNIVVQADQSANIEKPNLEKPKEKVKNQDKAIKVSQNDGTDTSDKLHTDINAIIDRKVRKGEVQMG